MDSSRPYDIVVYGATGYSGTITAEYLAKYSLKVKWSIAGRSESKLKMLQGRLLHINPSEVDYHIADANNYEQILELAQKTKVLCSFVGPYRLFGELIVRACVEAGTDYVDVTGEPPFIANLIEKYHDAAVEKNIYLLPACGIGSLITDFSVELLKRQFAMDHLFVVQAQGYLKYNGRHAKTFSNGTWNTLINSMANKVSHAKSSTRPTAKSVPTRKKSPRLGAHFYRPLKNWALPFVEGADLHTIRRTNQLTLGHTGSNDFSYEQFTLLPLFPPLWLLGTLILLCIITFFSKFALVRRYLLTLTAPDGGPTLLERLDSSVDLWVVAQDDKKKQKQLHMHCPGPYDTTAIACAETALALATERSSLEKKYGVVTPASVLSDSLQVNLKRSGITWSISDKDK